MSLEEKNVITLSLMEYNELRDFKRDIENDKVLITQPSRYVYSGHTSILLSGITIEYKTNSEAIKKLGDDYRNLLKMYDELLMKFNKNEPPKRPIWKWRI